MDDEIDRIREAKREELRERIAQRSSSSAPEMETASRSDSPTRTADEPIAIDGVDHLETILERNPLVLVDFYADWCGPCQMLAPILERIADQTPAVVAKVDTDTHPPLAEQYAIRGLPTLVVTVDGEPVDRLIGMQSEEHIRRTIERYTPTDQ